VRPPPGRRNQLPARSRNLARVSAGILIAAAVSACGGAGTDASPDAATGAAAGSAILTVFAAASLQRTFTTLGQQFETTHPGTTVRFTFAGSSDLVGQLQQGAPADVFASADTQNMAKATADHLVAGAPRIFASNTLEIAVPPDNPAGVGSFPDLADPRVKLVVCAPAVPCGSATRKIEVATGIDLLPVSEELAVTDVLNKVQTGEADAGLVYVTDVRGAEGKVKGVAFPEAKAAVNRYPIAALSASKHPALAGEFVDLVTGPAGQRVLADAGFGRP